MDLSTIVINYKSRDDLTECLNALEADARNSGLSMETVVLDNDSRDGTPGMLAERYPWVKVIANAENVGYARAVNQGIRATSAPVVLVLNPDCVPQPGALRAMLEHLRSQPKAAMVGPKLINPGGHHEYSARTFPTALTFLFNRYSLLTRLFPGNPWSRAYLLSDWDHNTPRDVDWLTGACMLVRREAIDQVGGMDEAFFMFNEDVDWCRRFHLAGWTNRYFPDAQVLHHVGASRRKVAARVIWARHQGMYHYYQKHYSPNPLVAATVWGIIMVRALLMLVHNALRSA